VKVEKTALVTGASSGIGRAVALLLSRNGFRVFGTTRRASPPGNLRGDVEWVQLDVRDDNSVETCVRTVLERAGRIDVLVNNAGYTLVGAQEETSLEEAKQLFETNFFGVLRVTRAVLPAMRKQAAGRIVSIGSMVGFLPAPYQGIYAASKHALEGYSESLDHEVRQFGIRASVVEPGFTRTEIDKNAEVVRDQLAPYQVERAHVLDAIKVNNEQGKRPEEVAQVVLTALTSRTPRARYLVGTGAKLVASMRNLAPASVFDRALRKQFKLATA
jgi:short-subunit dehydrogenase